MEPKVQKGSDLSTMWKEKEVLCNEIVTVSQKEKASTGSSYNIKCVWDVFCFWNLVMLNSCFISILCVANWIEFVTTDE